MAVDVQTNPTFAPGREKVLFETTGFLSGGNNSLYDVSRDGRFVMLRAPSSTAATRLILVQNFFEELKAKAPAN